MNEPNPNDMRTAKIDFSVAGRAVSLQVQVPAGPVSPTRLLPLAYALANTIVDMAVQAQPETVSCSRGCYACCLQLVPVSTIEARAIHALVQALEEPRRSTVRARFADACRTMEAAGLMEGLRDFSRIAKQDLVAFGHDYFAHRVHCPFLEDESCSIYAERPVICREFLVTSDARHCDNPSAQTIRRIELDARVSRALPALEAPDVAPAMPWIPLILALEWVDAHPDDNERPGPELLQALFARLSGKDLPAPPGLGA
ncbi:MAG: YkgJ family cysteine cluster protein [Sterolibacteriaceae bacterium]|nr:YkgJ family cysteine cluster protein [Candidatus Methylophosphatis haderslevensis]